MLFDALCAWLVIENGIITFNVNFSILLQVCFPRTYACGREFALAVHTKRNKWEIEDIKRNETLGFMQVSWCRYVSERRRKSL